MSVSPSPRSGTDVDAGEGGVTLSGRIEGTDPDQPVHPALAAQVAVGVRPRRPARSPSAPRIPPPPGGRRLRSGTPGTPRSAGTSAEACPPSHRPPFRRRPRGWSGRRRPQSCSPSRRSSSSKGRRGSALDGLANSEATSASEASSASSPRHLFRSTPEVLSARASSCRNGSSLPFSRETASMTFCASSLSSQNPGLGHHAPPRAPSFWLRGQPGQR